MLSLPSALAAPVAARKAVVLALDLQHVYWLLQVGCVDEREASFSMCMHAATWHHRDERWTLQLRN